MTCLDDLGGRGEREGRRERERGGGGESECALCTSAKILQHLPASIQYIVHLGLGLSGELEGFYTSA